MELTTSSLELPKVNFGKYNGQPITKLLNDTSYREWCLNQGFFRHPKYKIIYNICVNQSLPSSIQNTKTPEHNKLQNLFLNYENVQKLLKMVFNNKCTTHLLIDNGHTEFEGIFNWDMIFQDNEWTRCSCDDNIDTCNCDINMQHKKRYNIPNGSTYLSFYNVYCEIKPLMGDDYPCVLRKMKNQIELTQNHNDKINKQRTEKFKNDTAIYNELKVRRFNFHQSLIRSKFVLLLKEFNATSATKEDLQEIFNQSNIMIIFIDDLFNNYQNQKKRKQLEQTQQAEVLSLKTTKQTTITDYFRK